MKRGGVYLLLALMSILNTSCQVLPFAIPIVVSGAGGSIAYTITNISYKTLSYPIRKVEGAARAAMRRMEIKEVVRQELPDGVRIEAQTTKLRIYIDLEPVTPSTTRIRVDAVKDKVFKDKATATEIIIQTEKALEGEGKR